MDDQETTEFFSVDVSQDAPNFVRRDVDLHHKGETNGGADQAFLLRSRLTLFCELLFFGIGIFLVRDMALGGTNYFSRIFVLLALSAAIAALKSKRHLSGQ